MKYTIAFDADIFARQSNGGISVHFYHLITNLSRFRSVFLFYHSSKSKLIQKNSYFKLLSENKSIFVYKYSSLIGLKRVLINAQISIIAATYYSLVPLILGLPTIYTFHDAGQIKFIYKYFTLSRCLAFIAQTLTLNQASGISSDSQFSKAELLRYILIFPLFRNKPIYVTGNSSSLPLPPFSPKPDLNDSSLHLLYIGTRSFNKNFLSIIPAIAQLQNDIPCTLTISGGPLLSPKEINLLNSFDIKYTFQNNPSSPQLVQFYRQADIFIHSSMYEGFGITILESLTHSLLTVAVKIPPVFEIAGDSIIYSESNTSIDIYHALRKAAFFRETKDSNFSSLVRQKHPNLIGTLL